MTFGTIDLGDGQKIYNEHANLLCTTYVWSQTMLFGRPFGNYISNAEYATQLAATIFASCFPNGKLFDQGALETTTATVNATKYGISMDMPQGNVTVPCTANAGAIATILGNDPGFGTGDAKDGHIAEAFGQTYEANPSFWKGIAGRLLARVEHVYAFGF